MLLKYKSGDLEPQVRSRHDLAGSHHHLNMYNKSGDSEPQVRSRHDLTINSHDLPM